jgi:hypothetical protein
VVDIIDFVERDKCGHVGPRLSCGGVRTRGVRDSTGDLGGNAVYVAPVLAKSTIKWNVRSGDGVRGRGQMIACNLLCPPRSPFSFAVSTNVSKDVTRTEVPPIERHRRPRDAYQVGALRARRRRRHHHRQRTSRKKSRTSCTKSSGCSKAAKWPPRSPAVGEDQGSGHPPGWLDYPSRTAIAPERSHSCRWYWR